MDRKGQALIEFIIILPVIIYLLMVIVDFSSILIKKNGLESKMNDVVSLYKEGKSEEISDYLDGISYDEVISDKYITFKLSIKYDFITPGLSLVTKGDYNIKSERTVLK